MSQASPPMLTLARRLMAGEAQGNKSSGTKIPEAFHVCEKLRLHLTNYLGNTGFRTLLSRSLALSADKAPWLGAVQVDAAWSFERTGELNGQVDPHELFEGGVVLVAQLLGLLAAFIGENLMLLLVRDVWPKVTLNDLDFGKAGKHEKAKKGGKTEGAAPGREPLAQGHHP